MSKDKDYESIKNKIRKLNALVERGEEGEALAAKRVLTNLLWRYGLTLESVLDATSMKRWYEFKPKSKLLMQLLGQCYFKALDKTSMTAKKDRESRSVFLELTPMEYAEVRSLYEWHKSQFTAELERTSSELLSAYVSKHNLNPEHIPEDKQPSSLKDVDLEKARRVMLLEGTLDDKYYTKMIDK